MLFQSKRFTRFLLFFFSTFMVIFGINAQVQEGLPKPRGPVDLSQTSNIIIFIVLPAIVIILFFFWRSANKKKVKEQEENNKIK